MDKVIFVTKLEDVRPIDFNSGKRLPVAPNERKECQCCGKKIFKVATLNTGHQVGTECADILAITLRYQKTETPEQMKFHGVTQKQKDFYNMIVK